MSKKRMHGIRRSFAAMLATMMILQLCLPAAAAVEEPAAGGQNAAREVVLSGRGAASPSDAVGDGEAFDDPEDEEQEELEDGEIINDLASPSDAEEMDRLEDGEIANDLASPSDAERVITEFVNLADEIRYQTVAVGAKESDLILPDVLAVRSDEAQWELPDITWDIAPEYSVKADFDAGQTPEQYFGVDEEGNIDYAGASQEKREAYVDMSGAYYTYRPLLPDTDLYGNDIILTDDIALPEIYVQIGKNTVMLLGDAEAVDNPVVDLSTLTGVLKLKEENAAKYYSMDGGNSWYEYTGSITLSDGAGEPSANQAVRVESGSHQVTLKDATLTGDDHSGCPFDITSGAAVELTLEGENKANIASTSYAGIRVPAGASLTITEGSSGSLAAGGGTGIGGSEDEAGGNITIHGGTVTASSCGLGAGIGGGNHGAGGVITITGGTVTASGRFLSAGIGGGYKGAGGTITISGGNIKATAGTNASTIGNGDDCSDSFSLVDESGNAVSLTTVSLDWITQEQGVAALTLNNGVTYGTSGMTLLDTNKLYLYLPAEAAVVSVTLDDGTTKSGYITAGSSGTLYDEYKYRLVYTEPEYTFYTGRPIIPVVQWSASDGVVEGLGKITLQYKKDGGTDYMTAAPVDPGVYDVYASTEASSENPEIKEQWMGSFRIYLKEDLNIDLSTLTGTLKLKEDNSTKYYSTDGGTAWVEYTDSITLSDGAGEPAENQTVSVESGSHWITLKNATLTGNSASHCPFYIASGAAVRLTLEGENKATTSHSNYAGIQVPKEASLTITEGSSGTVTASGGEFGAGIGGGSSGSGGSITINSGTITASGGSKGAGIGGGSYGSGSSIIINGGTVKANGGLNSAGIGGGYFGAGGSIAINGGTVTANGGELGAGIGGGRNCAGGDIVICGGNIKAVAGTDASAIGNGFGGSDKTFTLTDGNGNDVSLTTLSLEGITGEQGVKALILTNGVDYGITDMVLLDTNKLYLYLPAETAVGSVTLEDGTSFSFLVGDTYYISTAGQMDAFAQLVNEGQNSLNAVLLEGIALDDSFPRIGTDAYPYTGTFDGGRHTITVSYSGIADANAGGIFDQTGSATIRNLTVTGQISSTRQYVGGVVAYVQKGAALELEQVLSTVDITSTASGDNTHGGIVAHSDGSVAMTNCGYAGTITASDGINCGGLLGWSNTSAVFMDCYMAGEMQLSSDDGSATFSRGKGVSLTRCYYRNSYGTAQGTSKTAEEFENGTVAWLLNSEGGYNSIHHAIWGQDGGIPVLVDDDHNAIYRAQFRYRYGDIYLTKDTKYLAAGAELTAPEFGDEEYYDWVSDIPKTMPAFNVSYYAEIRTPRITNKEEGGYDTTQYAGTVVTPTSDHFDTNGDTKEMSFCWYAGSFTKTEELDGQTPIDGLPAEGGEYTLHVQTPETTKCKAGSLLLPVTVKGQRIPETGVRAHSLSLDGSIGVNFYLELAQEVRQNASDYYVVVSNESGTSYRQVEVSTVIANGSKTITDSQNVTYSCYKVSGYAAAKEMTDALTMKLMKRGDTASLLEESYSVADYLEKAKTDGSEETKALTAAMAVYGAYSQQYFHYHTERQPVDVSTVDVSGVTPETLASYTYTLTEAEGEIPVTYYASSLLLETNTTLRHYFEVTGDISALTFRVDGSEVTATQSPKDSTQYYIEIADISAPDLENAYTVTVENGSDVCVTLENYSPLTYVKKALESSRASAEIKPVGQALYLYWKRADAYTYQ